MMCTKQLMVADGHAICDTVKCIIISSVHNYITYIYSVAWPDLFLLYLNREKGSGYLTIATESTDIIYC